MDAARPEASAWGSSSSRWEIRARGPTPPPRAVAFLRLLIILTSPGGSKRLPACHSYREASTPRDQLPHIGDGQPRQILWHEPNDVRAKPSLSVAKPERDRVIPQRPMPAIVAVAIEDRLIVRECLADDLPRVGDLLLARLAVSIPHWVGQSIRAAGCPPLVRRFERQGGGASRNMGPTPDGAAQARVGVPRHEVLRLSIRSSLPRTCSRASLAAPSPGPRSRCWCPLRGRRRGSAPRRRPGPKRRRRVSGLIRHALTPVARECRAVPASLVTTGRRRHRPALASPSSARLSMAP